MPYINENNEGDIYVIITAVDYLLATANPPTKFIPGHGPVCSITELAHYRKLLVSIRDQVSGFIKNGFTLEKIMGEVQIDKKMQGVGREDFMLMYKKWLCSKKKLTNN